jgi:hypothetical protein
LDTTDEAAFPSLASAAPTTNANSVWGSAAGPRIKPSVNKAPVFIDSFNLSSIDLSNAGKDGKSATLGEVIKQVIAKYKVKIEASANQKALQTTFHVKAESQKELDKAKRSLLALLSPTVCSPFFYFIRYTLTTLCVGYSRHQCARVNYRLNHWS